MVWDLGLYTGVGVWGLSAWGLLCSVEDLGIYGF